MRTLKRRLESVVVREVGQETILLDVGSDQIHQLNRTASFIWNQCENAESVDQIAHWLTEAFEVEAAVALQDAEAILARFHDLKLVSDADGS